ncbi:putative ribonuclease H-like domain-containing protein [Tanacetum coccineum]
MYDQKNKVLFTDTECLVLSPEFKLPDENQVLLRIPRQNNMYSLNLENIIPSGGLACLIAKAIIDESNKWHRSHLIRDCDFHEKRMAKQAELNNRMCKESSQREVRPIWNNVKRMNHQNQFVPKAVLTRAGNIPVNTARASGTNNVSTARHNFNRHAVPTNAAKKVNTVKPIVNNARPKADFHKTLSPFRKPFNRTTTLRTNFSYQKVNTAEENTVSAVGGKRETAVKPSAGCNWRHKRHYWNKVSKYNGGSSSRNCDYPQRALQNKGIVDSGCSRHMTRNKAYLAEYQDFNGGPVAFGGSKGYITGKGKIKIGKLDFEDVCFVKELQHFNLFSVSQMCDKKNKVLFTDSECFVLSPEFKLPDENQVLLRIPRQNNMYSFNLENIVPSGGLACLIAKATIDESNKWHRRLGHVNFKNLNKLVKGNLVRGLPSKIFQNDHTCVACQKGKQHKASCKAKSVSSISQPLQLLHMDLFGPTSVRSLNHKTYCLVITDDFSRCDNGTKFKNSDFIEFCGSKGIKREYSNARTPQQNGVAERKNKTLIEAARTMLADSFLPNTFWAEAVSTACYVLNRVLVTKPQNKTPYELITGKIPIISYIRPFGCHVTILNTIDHLGKFDGKSDEGFLVGYSLQSKAFRVYNLETKRVEENLHITFLENKPNVAGKGPTWLFDLDYLTDSMNYQPVRSENQANKHAGPQEANHNAGTEDNNDAGDSEIEVESAQDYFVLPIWSSYTSTVKSSKAKNAGEEPYKHPDFKPIDKEDQVFLDELERLKRQEKDANNAAEALRKEFAQETEDLLIQAGAAKTSSFVDPKFPKKVYKVEKALYGLHEAPKALYATLSTFLLKSGYRRGTIDKTLFIKKDKNNHVVIVCACSRFRVTPKTSHLHAVKRIFRRHILWQCKKKKIVAASTIEADYVAVANCCGQVLWIQNQMLDYGFNFMNTKIYIDNESIICIGKESSVFSRPTQSMRLGTTSLGCYEKKLIPVIKIPLLMIMSWKIDVKVHFDHGMLIENLIRIAILRAIATSKEITNPLWPEEVEEEFQVYRVTKEFKFIKEHIKE